jgi:hypothetical protein
MNKPTRQELISLCEQGIIPVEKWANNDTTAAQLQLGSCWLSLKAGCKFEIKNIGIYLITLIVFYPIFCTNENGESLNSSELAEGSFVIPTQRRLDEKKGEDWY